MVAFSNGRAVKTYRISLGREPVGRKETEGDKRTPEGQYFINDKNPNSAYHKALGVSYPNSDDVLRARNLGRPPGGQIKVHGLRHNVKFIGKFHRWFDWTGMHCGY